MALVFDDPEQEGVVLCFDIDELDLGQLPDSSPCITARMDDNQARDLIDIVRNKIDARL